MHGKWKIMAIVIALIISMTACTAGESGVTGEMTTTSDQMIERRKTEEELGIERPMRFAEDVAIVDASDALKEKQYEVPYRLDEKHVMLVSKPLAKGLLSATVYELGDNPATAWEQLTVTAVGYYDLEKKSS